MTYFPVSCIYWPLKFVFFVSIQSITFGEAFTKAKLIFDGQENIVRVLDISLQPYAPQK